MDDKVQIPLMWYLTVYTRGTAPGSVREWNLYLCLCCRGMKQKEKGLTSNVPCSVRKQSCIYIHRAWMRSDPFMLFLFNGPNIYFLLSKSDFIFHFPTIWHFMFVLAAPFSIGAGGKVPVMFCLETNTTSKLNKGLSNILYMLYIHKQCLILSYTVKSGIQIMVSTKKGLLKNIEELEPLAYDNRPHGTFSITSAVPVDPGSATLHSSAIPPPCHAHQSATLTFSFSRNTRFIHPFI